MSGSSSTSVTRRMPGPTYSPGDTQRPSTRPANGARTTPSAIDFDTSPSWALVAATVCAAAVQLVISRSYWAISPSAMVRRALIFPQSPKRGQTKMKFKCL